MNKIEFGDCRETMKKWASAFNKPWEGAAKEESPQIGLDF